MLKGGLQFLAGVGVGSLVSLFLLRQEFIETSSYQEAAINDIRKKVVETMEVKTK